MLASRSGSRGPLVGVVSLAPSRNARLPVDAAVDARCAARAARDDLVADGAHLALAASSAVRGTAGARVRQLARAARAREHARLAPGAGMAILGATPARVLAHADRAARSGAASAARRRASRTEATAARSRQAAVLPGCAARARRTATAARGAGRTRRRAGVRVDAAAGAVRGAAPGLRMHAGATAAAVARPAGDARLARDAARARGAVHDARVVRQAAPVGARAGNPTRVGHGSSVARRGSPGAPARAAARHAGVAEERRPVQDGRVPASAGMEEVGETLRREALMRTASFACYRETVAVGWIGSNW